MIDGPRVIVAPVQPRGDNMPVRAWLTLTACLCGLSASASLAVHWLTPVMHHEQQRGRINDR